MNLFRSTTWFFIADQAWNLPIWYRKKYALLYQQLTCLAASKPIPPWLGLQSIYGMGESPFQSVFISVPTSIQTFSIRHSVSPRSLWQFIILNLPNTLKTCVLVPIPSPRYQYLPRRPTRRATHKRPGGAADRGPFGFWRWKPPLYEGMMATVWMVSMVMMTIVLKKKI